MEVHISKSELAKILLIPQAIADKKSTMPILGNLLIQAEKGILKLTGSDLEITAIASCAAEVKTLGSITVNSKLFGELVRELPDVPLIIRSDSRDRLEVESRNSLVKLNGVSATEYPAPPGLALAVRSKVPAKVLSEMINKTVYAVSLDESRFNMSGACIELVEGDGKSGTGPGLRMVATDGHRLAMITRPIENLKLSGLKGGGRDHVIVPRKGLLEMRKALEVDPSLEVGLDINEGFVILEVGTLRVVTRVLDGEFPDYSPVIPAKGGEKAIVLSEELAQALRRVSLLVSDKSKGVRLDFTPGALRITSSSPELGEGEEKLSIQYTGKPLSIGFNARYVQDVINSLGENQPIVIELHGETGPGKIYAEVDPSYIAIVMPLRLD